MTNVVGEKDKPFFLVMTGTILMFASIVYCLYIGQWVVTYQELWKDISLMWVPLVAAGWTYYFKTKSDQVTVERLRKENNP